MRPYELVVCLAHPDDLAAALAPFGADHTGTTPVTATGVTARGAGYGPTWTRGHSPLPYFPVRVGHSGDPRLLGEHDHLCDGGPKQLLDLDGMRAQAAALAEQRYENWRDTVADTPPGRPRDHFRRRHYGDPGGYPAAVAADDYDEQPRMHALAENLPLLRPDEVDDPLHEYQVPNATYVQRARAAAVPAAAVITLDGRWLGPTPTAMNPYRACPCAHHASAGYLETANAALDAVPEATYLVYVRCLPRGKRVPVVNEPSATLSAQLHSVDHITPAEASHAIPLLHAVVGALCMAADQISGEDVTLDEALSIGSSVADIDGLALGFHGWVFAQSVDYLEEAYGRYDTRDSMLAWARTRPLPELAAYLWRAARLAIVDRDQISDTAMRGVLCTAAELDGIPARTFHTP